MNKFWDILILPILKQTNLKHIVEIGCDCGKNTKLLLEFCKRHNAKLTAIDPIIGFDLDNFKNKYGNIFDYRQELSLSVLPIIDDYDVVLIDGDHNWYTVYNELKIIEKKNVGKKFPIIFLHDVCWPYGRRDLYYNPNNIPEIYRQPFKKLGMLPGTSNLLEDGFNCHLFNSIYENNPQNGVMTAIEDFMNETDRNLLLEVIEAFHGIAIITDNKDEWVFNVVRDCYRNIIQKLEKERVDSLSSLNVNLKKIRRNFELKEQEYDHIFKEKELLYNLNNQLNEKIQLLETNLNKAFEKYELANKKINDLIELQKKEEHEKKNLSKTHELSEQNEQLKLTINTLHEQINLLNKNHEQEINDLKSQKKRIENELISKNNSLLKAEIAAKTHLNSIKYRLGDTIISARKPSNLIKLPINLFRLFREGINKKKAVKRSFNGLNLKSEISYDVLKNNPYDNTPEFHNYLIWSVINKKLVTPFNEKHNKILKCFDSIKTDLINKYKKVKQQDKVSIIMPVYNRANIITLSINSIINQSYENWELIIVDDGSMDFNELKKQVEKFNDDRILFVRLNQNKGVSYARNFGLRKATGKYIAYLDSDNEWDENYLLIMVNMLGENTKVKSAYCAQYVYMNKNLHSIRFGLFNRSLLENHNYIDLNCFIHHIDLYHSKGGFDESLKRLVDWDLILRYTESDFPVAVPCILGRYYHKRASNQITATANLEKNMEIVREKLSLNKLDITDKYLMYANNTIVRNCINKRKVSIIIPSYEAFDSLMICIKALFAYTNKNHFEIILVDNNSSKQVKDFLRKLEKENDNVKVIFNSHNMGFTYAVNQGIEIADKKNDILLLNNDAIVSPGWLEALYEVFNKIQRVGIVAPRQVLLPLTKTNKIHVPSCDPNYEVDVNLSQHHNNILDPFIFSHKGFIQLSFVPFFCVLISRECLEDIGMLDYKNGRHYKSDRLYCKECANKNYKIIYTPHSKVYHLLQQSTDELKNKDNKLYENMFLKNQWDANELPLLKKEIININTNDIKLVKDITEVSKKDGKYKVTGNDPIIELNFKSGLINEVSFDLNVQTKSFTRSFTEVYWQTDNHKYYSNNLSTAKEIKLNRKANYKLLINNCGEKIRKIRIDHPNREVADIELTNIKLKYGDYGVKIYQIYYDDCQKKELDKSFIPYFNLDEESKIWHEYSVFLKEYLSGKVVKPHYTGYVSWKFNHKTGISGEEFIKFIYDNPGYDVYTINPFQHLNSIVDNVWLHGDFYHPGLLKLAKDIFNSLNYNIDLDNLINTPDTLVFCNYWVGNKTFWDEYIKFTKPVYEYIKYAEKEKKNKFFSHTNYCSNNKKTFVPFIMERMLTTLLVSNKQIKHKNYVYTEKNIPEMINFFRKRNEETVRILESS